MAKKKEESGEKKSKLQEALESLNRKYGVGSVLTLDDRGGGDYEVIPTGSIGFDYTVLGTGGFARGKMYEIMSWEGAGKTTLCGHAVAESQKKGWKALYIDGEHAMDKKYFQSLGVDTSDMLLAQPSCGEEGFNIAMEMIETGELGLVVIDSDSSLIPRKMLDGDVGDSTIGRKALLNSNAYPKLKTAIDKHNVCLIVLSQYREKIGVMFGNPTTTQGGHALKFYADCRIELTKSLAKDGDTTYGNITKVKAIKNKMSPPFRIAQFEIIYGIGIDKMKEIMELASDFEILKKWGKTITYKEIKYNEEEFATLLEDNPEFHTQLKQDIINRIKNIEAPIIEEKEEEKLIEELEPLVDNDLLKEEY